MIMEAVTDHLQVTFKVLTDKKAQSIEVIHTHSRHSHLRACQRSLNRDKITIVLQYGEAVYKQGLVFYILGEKNIPPAFIKRKDTLKNTIVVVSGRSNQLITCYRSSNPFKNIKTKSKKLSVRYNKAA